MKESNPAHDIKGALSLDQLDTATGGAKGGPVVYQDGILAIGYPGIVGVFIGAGCIGGWLGGTGIAYCPK